MAIKINSSDEAVAGSGISLYSGLINMKVLAINPSLKDLHELGMEYIKQEPKYSNIDINGKSHNKIVFWLTNGEHKFSVKSEFLVQNTPRTNRDGNRFQWVNREGIFTWGSETEVDKYDWYSEEGIRLAHPGEENLTKFVRALFNVRSGDDCKLDVEVFNNDVSSLKNDNAARPDNEVRCLTGVKDNKYQEIYTHCFGRIKPQRDSEFFKALSDDFQQFKAEFNPTLEFGEWTGSTISPSSVNAAENVKMDNSLF